VKGKPVVTRQQVFFYAAPPRSSLVALGVEFCFAKLLKDLLRQQQVFRYPHCFFQAYKPLTC
jgi:hypothetical protein